MTSTTATSHLTYEEVCERGERQFQSKLTELLPVEGGKHIAIDVVTGEHELDVDEMGAIRKVFDKFRYPRVVCGQIRQGATSRPFELSPQQIRRQEFKAALRRANRMGLSE